MSEELNIDTVKFARELIGLMHIDPDVVEESDPDFIPDLCKMLEEWRDAKKKLKKKIYFLEEIKATIDENYDENGNRKQKDNDVDIVIIDHMNKIK